MRHVSGTCMHVPAWRRLRRQDPISFFLEHAPRTTDPQAADTARRGSSARACAISSRTASPPSPSPAPSSDARASACSEPSRSSNRNRRRPVAPTRPRLRRALGGALGGLVGEVDRAHVLVDAGREAVRRRAVAVDARPVAHRARRGLEVVGLPERERHHAQHRHVRGARRRARRSGAARRARSRPRRARAGPRS